MKPLELCRLLASLLTLLLLGTFAVCNCRAVLSGCEELLETTVALPEKGSDAAAALADLRQIWNEKKQFFRISVRRELLLAAETALGNLECLAASKENADYLAAKAAFYATVEDICLRERPSWESIL